MQRLIDANELKMSVILPRCGAKTIIGDAIRKMIDSAPTIDAVPLDGSFLKMSKGDYLIYNRHWLYEHFDMEMEIQRSAMKSMGYEPALKDAEPHWILTGDAEPEHCHMVLISVFNAKTDMRFVDTGALYSDGWYGSGWKLPDYCIVTAWQELPKPYEVEE